MKKTIFPIIILLAMALSANAQLVSSSSLVITKAKLPPVEAGYEQSVDASYSLMLTGRNNLEANVSYIGGYRFNNTVFLGVGTGFSIADAVAEQNSGTGYLSLPTLNIPLYAHIRAYFLKSRVSPFAAVSAGGRLSTPKDYILETDEKVKYKTIGLYLNPSIGVNYRVSAKTALYLSVGFKGMTVPAAESVEYNSLMVRNKFVYGIDYHIGITF